jgi:Wings apart-like protein regulation of heterochromatin
VSGDENKNVTNAPAVTTTDELIAVLSGESPAPVVEPKPEKLKIRIKKDYIRSYNDSLKEQAAVAPPPEPVPEIRTTRRRGKQQEASPLVSEFDSQSSVLGSENTNTVSTGIVDSRVIRSRGSSVVTSDMDGTSQASLAAAPPSGEENNSSNIAMEVDEQPVIPQKGRRGRKKAPEVVMKPPEPAPVPVPVTIKTPPARKTRNAKTAAPVVPELDASIETISTRIDVTPEKPAGGRVTRNTRNAAPSTPSTTESPVAAPRFLTRKRKNPPPVEEEKPNFAPEEETDQSSALNLSQKSASDLSSFSSGVDRHSLAPSTASSSAVSSVPEYKHKKLVKRSWEQDKLQQAQIIVPDPPAPVADNSVKLLISKKKGSIFKSRAMDKDEDSNKKQQRLNLYKHKWDEDVEMTEDGPINATKKPEKTEEPQKVEEKVELDRTFDDFEDDAPMRRPKFVRNVKKAHQIQEIGEFQEMDDDVEYLLDALQPNIQVATRCLSALQLASKCMTPSFRMHIRAHGIVPKFFKALEDAPSDASLGLCTAMVMFALSQDTLKMDLDRGSLELMLNLLECEGSHKQHGKDNKQHLERKQKVRELCEEIQSQGKSIHLNLEHITAAQLAMESLLSLTSKRAGEWLKEDLRELGGIEHIIKTVCECCQQITEYVTEWTEPLLEKLNKIERCMRILENVTSNNEENQKYVLHHKSQMFVKALCRFFHLLHTELTLYPTTEKSPKESAGVAIREALVPLLKVIINLTHPFNDRGEFWDFFKTII